MLDEASGGTGKAQPYPWQKLIPTDTPSEAPRVKLRFTHVTRLLAGALSLSLCFSTLALWARSYWRTDVAWTMARGYVVGVNSETGRLLISGSAGWQPEARGGRRHTQRTDVALWQQVKRLFVFRAGDAGGGVWALQVPHWSLCVAASAPALLWLRRRRAEHRRRTAGNCRRCGYDLRASGERCPECGEPVRPATRETRSPEHEIRNKSE